MGGGRASLAPAGQSREAVQLRREAVVRGGRRWLEAGSHRTSSRGQDFGFYSE